MAGENPEVALQISQTVQGFGDGAPAAAGQVGAATGTFKQGITGKNAVFTQQTNAAVTLVCSGVISIL